MKYDYKKIIQITKITNLLNIMIDEGATEQEIETVVKYRDLTIRNSFIQIDMLTSVYELNCKYKQK